MTRGCWPQPWPFSTRKKTTPKVPPARRFLHSKKMPASGQPSATSPKPRQNISRVSLWWRWTPPRRTASVNRRASRWTSIPNHGVPMKQWIWHLGTSKTGDPWDLVSSDEVMRGRSFLVYLVGLGLIYW